VYYLNFKDFAIPKPRGLRSGIGLVVPKFWIRPSVNTIHHSDKWTASPTGAFSLDQMSHKDGRKQRRHGRKEEEEAGRRREKVERARCRKCTDVHVWT